MHKIVIAIGFINLMLSVVEFLRPDLWENLWRDWVRSRFFRLHGLVLIAIAVVLAVAMPVIHLQWFLWLAILFLSLIGSTILTNPKLIANPIIEFYQSRSEEEIHRFTYMDAGLRVSIALCLIFSVIE